LLLIFFVVAHSISGQICLVNGITTSWKTMYKETKIFTSLQETVDQATETHFRIILPKNVFTMNSSLRISNKKIELIGVPFLNQVLELFEEVCILLFCCFVVLFVLMQIFQ
jgi:hypothetical protein